MPAAPSYRRYILPFFVYFFLSFLQKKISPDFIFSFYALKVVVLAILLFFCFRKHFEEIPGSFEWRACLIGFAVFVIWVLPEALSGQRHASLLTFSEFQSPVWAATLIFFRIAGSALVIPFVEEIFWRSFFMRYLIKTDFLNVPLGNYAPFSFWATALAFSSSHAVWQWPVAFIAGILYGGYLVKTKNLKGCILAHGTTNFCLAIYVLLTKQWQFW